MSFLEVPIFGPEHAWHAVCKGPTRTRLELNRAGSYSVGGLTPTLDEYLALFSKPTIPAPDPVRSFHIPIRIMIRPRGPPPASSGEPDFIYTEDEIEGMANAITMFRSSEHFDPKRGDGFVFGVLKKKTPAPSPLPPSEGVEIDIEQNKRLISLAKGASCIFHRAFDEVLDSLDDNPHIIDPERSEEAIPPPGVNDNPLYDLIERCGFNGVLTSGGRGSAVGESNVDTLHEIINYVHHHQIILAGARREFEIIVGGGVRSSNLDELSRRLLSTCPRGRCCCHPQRCCFSKCARARFRIVSHDAEEERRRSDLACSCGRCDHANNSRPACLWFHSSCMTTTEDGDAAFDEQENARFVEVGEAVALREEHDQDFDDERATPRVWSFTG